MLLVVIVFMFQLSSCLSCLVIHTLQSNLQISDFDRSHWSKRHPMTLKDIPWNHAVAIAMDHHRLSFHGCFLIQAISLTRDIALYHSTETKSQFGWPFMGKRIGKNDQKSNLHGNLLRSNVFQLAWCTSENLNFTGTSDRFVSKWDGLIFVPASKWWKHRVPVTMVMLCWKPVVEVPTSHEERATPDMFDRFHQDPHNVSSRMPRSWKFADSLEWRVCCS